MTSSKQWFVIVNPTSGNGASKTKWPKIKHHLETNNFIFEFEYTKHEKHSAELVQNAVSQGFRRFIIVGGDGTIHNVVNAIHTQKYCSPHDIHFGVIAIGTGNDWIKTYNLPKDYKKAIACIKKGELKQQDIGKIEFINQNKRPIYFNNLAGIGFDGFVVSKVSHYKHFGAIAYLVAALIGLFSFKNFKAKVVLDKDAYNVNVLMVVVGLCRFSGGGMQLTHLPQMTDGLFDVSIAKDFTKFDIIKNLFKLFNGKINTSKQIITLKTDCLEIYVDSKNSPLVEADGELIGKGSFKVSILKSSLQFYA